MTALEPETLGAGLFILFIGGLVRATAVMIALSGRSMKYQARRSADRDMHAEMFKSAPNIPVLQTCIYINKFICIHAHTQTIVNDR